MRRGIYFIGDGTWSEASLMKHSQICRKSNDTPLSHTRNVSLYLASSSMLSPSYHVCVLVQNAVELLQ